MAHTRGPSHVSPSLLLRVSGCRRAMTPRQGGPSSARGRRIAESNTTQVDIAGVRAVVVLAAAKARADYRGILRRY
jgi:hypothetical protein